MSTNGYVHPEVLVETGWVAQHYKDANIRLVEVDVDTTASIRVTFLGQWAGTGTTTPRTPYVGMYLPRRSSKRC